MVDGQQRLTTLSLLVSVLRGLGDVIAPQPIAALQTLTTQNKKLPTEAEPSDEEEKVQFGPVINFPNFLLQVLALMPHKAEEKTPLDDKHLLDAFKAALYPSQETEGVELLVLRLQRVRYFAFVLLRCSK
ncbi:hypothetical protein [Simplicispira psychrophila]|uniref:hypothetical protein n=1 Tax=Simplicispira psychrophila TaxID=80882 RepID=UPI0004809EB8|nr:hypothetical protein [Simplicispira psychrophila]